MVTNSITSKLTYISKSNWNSECESLISNLTPFPNECLLNQNQQKNKGANKHLVWPINGKRPNPFRVQTLPFSFLSAASSQTQPIRARKLSYSGRQEDFLIFLEGPSSLSPTNKVQYRTTVLLYSFLCGYSTDFSLTPGISLDFFV